MCRPQLFGWVAIAYVQGFGLKAIAPFRMIGFEHPATREQSSGGFLFGRYDMDKTNNEISTARILAGFCSFLFPGLGQLLLGRPVTGILFFVMAILLWALAICMFWIGLESTVYWLCVLASLIAIMPNAIAAYNAANKSNTDMQQAKPEKQQAIKAEQNFIDYADYMAWCREQGHQPMPPTQYEQILGKNM